MREIVNAILYQSRTACQWSLLPHELPPRSAVMYYYAAWRMDATARVPQLVVTRDAEFRA
ncbi:transposase [Nonomuraea sp. NPDC049152]|uniref:transposase n=1 Tax=Nonomuraea sp. NPDC049152 TaxID=3154350 RepID=UPI0033C65397